MIGSTHQHATPTPHGAEAPGTFRLPPHLREPFVATEGLPFSDGTTVSAAEIWRFMTEEGPVRFPRNFEPNGPRPSRMSTDVGLFSGIKAAYLNLTLRDRLIKARNAGRPLVLVQGGQGTEPYFAAGAIAMRPAIVSQAYRDKEDGLDGNASDWKGQGIVEKGHHVVGPETCHLVGSHAAVQESVVEVDVVAPYLCLRCSDMAYLVEAQRHWKRSVPRLLIDFPVEKPRNSPWAVEYVAAQLRNLVTELSKITGKQTTDEDVREEIRTQNRIRKLTRELNALHVNAEVPPLNSIDFGTLMTLGNDAAADTVAIEALLKQALVEVRARVAKKVRAAGLVERPARLFVCGSCVTANPVVVDAAGGVIVGRDDRWNIIATDVQEDGSPYEGLARSILAYPYEQPTPERARWTIGEVKRTRAQGLAFIYAWGCNYQSAVARQVADTVKEELGIPTIVVANGELGRQNQNEQSHNRVESFIELLALERN